jgi:zinc protease
LIFKELEGIRGEELMSDDELAKFISYNVGRFGLSLESSESVLSSLVDLETYGLPEDSLNTYRSRIREITLEDVRSAANDYLHPERAAIVILGPAKEIVPQLEDLGEVEVWQP